LIAMTEARERSEWARTSTLMALIANAHRDAKKTRPFKPTDFDPFTQQEKKNVNDMALLKAMFTGMQKETNDA